MHPFAKRKSESVAAWGEERLITHIRRWLGNASPKSPYGIGDDCAVLRASSGEQLVTVDPVIFGRHFDASVPAQAVGEKLLKRNLSDIAAMGGRPVAAVVALTLGARVSQRWLEEFYRGIASTARRYRVAIVGGDVAQADGVLAASLTLLGESTGRVLTRGGAQTGDFIYVTGRLGLSVETGHHFLFTPRLKEGAWLARQPEVQAMIDVSDGLAKDLRAITPRGAAPAIDPASVPCRAGATLEIALTEGEDYELLFAVSRRTNRVAFAKRWDRAFPRVPLTHLGSFVRADKQPASTIDFARYHGYEHLR